MVGAVDARIVSVMQPRQSVAAGAQRAIDLFRAFDLDEDGAIGRPDDVLRDDVDLAQRRGWLLGEMLAVDLDGDLVITKDEDHRFEVANSWRRRPTWLDGLFQQADADGDGKVSVRELIGRFTGGSSARSTHEPARLRADAPVTSQEAYKVRVEVLFREADADRDGVLSLEEVNVARDGVDLPRLLN